MRAEALPKYIFWTIAAFLGLAVLYVLGTTLFCGLLGEKAWCRTWPHFSVSQITSYIRGAGAWGALVSIGLMMLHSFVPFPGEFIAIANGMVFGAFWGLVVTWVGAMMGAFLAFGITRRLGRDYVRRMLGRKAQAVEELSENYGGGAVFVSRFIPVISFNLINYAAGLSNVSWLTFAWATGLGILPITALMVVMGDQVHTMPWPAWLVFMAAGLSVWALGHLLYRRMRKKRRGEHLPPA